MQDLEERDRRTPQTAHFAFDRNSLCNSKICQHLAEASSLKCQPVTGALEVSREVGGVGFGALFREFSLLLLEFIVVIFVRQFENFLWSDIGSDSPLGKGIRMPNIGCRMSNPKVRVTILMSVQTSS